MRGFTLIEVLVAVAVLSTAFVSVMSLIGDSVVAIDRLTRRFEADLVARDALARFKLEEMGYNIERMHPVWDERHEDWDIIVERDPLTLEELPFVPVTPTGWNVEWIEVEVVDGEDRPLSSLRPLWARRSTQGGRFAR